MNNYNGAVTNARKTGDFYTGKVQVYDNGVVIHESYSCIKRLDLLDAIQDSNTLLTQYLKRKG